jgi:hypothetical protein
MSYAIIRVLASDDDMTTFASQAENASSILVARSRLDFVATIG